MEFHAIVYATMKRRIRKERLSELIHDKGGVARVSVDSGVSDSLLQKAKAGTYPGFISSETARKLRRYFGVTEDELFESVAPDTKDSA